MSEQYEQMWRDLKDRLTRNLIALDEIASTSARIRGKMSGVHMVVGYMDEAERQHDLVETQEQAAARREEVREEALAETKPTPVVKDPTDRIVLGAGEGEKGDNYEVVRYRKAKKYFIEYGSAERRQISLEQAVLYAKVAYLGKPGATTFDRAWRAANE